jgi:tRNA threonylcarbamoyl adenosine modification protein (Sua5/YciO/YrdC/YwlC family)
MLIEIFPDNIDQRKIAQVVGVLRRDGIIVYPTDTIYSAGCSLESGKGIEKLAKLKGIKPEKARFAIICSDLTHLGDYARQLDNPTFRLLKKMLPGPYTFILEAGGMVPRFFPGNRKTIGIRVPDHPVPRAIVEALGCPIITTSLHDQDEIMEYPTDPARIREDWEGKADLVIDSGPGGLIASTVVDLTSGTPVVVREGKGPVNW